MTIVRCLSFERIPLPAFWTVSVVTRSTSVRDYRSAHRYCSVLDYRSVRPFDPPAFGRARTFQTHAAAPSSGELKSEHTHRRFPKQAVQLIIVIKFFAPSIKFEHCFRKSSFRVSPSLSVSNMDLSPLVRLVRLVYMLCNQIAGFEHFQMMKTSKSAVYSGLSPRVL